MTIDDLKSLKEDQQTIEKLFKFINTSSLTEEVVFASYKLATILYKDRYYKETVKVLINKLSYFNHQKENHLYYDYLTLITNSYLKLEDKKNSSYFILQKKEATPISLQKSYYKDVLTYKTIFNEDIYPTLLELLNKPFDIASFFEYYLETFLNMLSNKSDDIEKTYNIIMGIDFSSEQKDEIQYHYIDFLYKQNNLKKLEELLQDKPKHIISYYKTLELIEEGLLIKVQLFEAENEKEYNKLSATHQKNLFKHLRDFYFDKDKLSYDLYRKKHDSVILEVSKEQVEKYKHKYVIPKKILDTEISEFTEETESLITLDKDLKILDEIINELISLKTETTFFNKVRSISRVLQTYLNFSDILYNFNGQVYHYKKERLYEKKYNKLIIDGSPLGVSANKFTDIVEKVEDIKYNFDLIENKPLTQTKIKQIYCYGLVDKSSMCFYQTRAKGIHIDKELFKVISNFISYEIQYYNKLNSYDKKHELTDSFFNNEEIIMFTYKDQLIGNSLFNDIFKLNKFDDIDNLISNFKPIEQRNYQNNLLKLRRREIKSFSVEVTFNNNIYLLTNYLSKGFLCGFFTPITNYKNEINKWQEKAFVNPLLDVLTLHEFEESFNDLINDKQTFFLIELDNLKNYESLYGKKVVKDYFLEFVDITKKYFNLIYQFDSNTLLTVVNKNDIRSITTLINDYLKQLENYESNILKLSSMNAFVSIIRYPIQTKETNVLKIYQYLSLSLLKAKKIRGNKRYHFFDFEDYQQDSFETEILRQIDRLIVDESLKLNFKQILNQKTNKVYSYQIGVYSDSLLVYETYYYELARRRGLLVKLEKYIIKQAFLYLKEIYQKAKTYIKITLNISNETLNSDSFIPFLISLFKTHNIPTSIVEFVYTGSFNQKDAEILTDLFNHNINVGVFDIEFIYLPFVKSYHFNKKVKPLSNKLENYLKQIKVFIKEQDMDLIVYNVDTELEKNQLQNIEVDYISGKAIDKTFTFDELLYLINKSIKNL